MPTSQELASASRSQMIRCSPFGRRMPTENEQWKVEAVVQYRCQYGTEQWLVKWKDY